MPVIYEPSGKAREYSELALNLYSGCAHKCKYCYCPAIRRMSLEEWAAHPKARTDILKQVAREARKMSGCEKEVLLSFMSDPYQDEEAAFLTREALLILERNGFRKVQILTKAGFRAVKDFDIIQRNPEWKFGSTIIMRDDALREEWEPGAPSIESRYDAVKIACSRGIFTWVSVEPVVDPAEALKVIKDLLPYVAFWKVGKLNHDKPTEDAIDWTAFLAEVRTALCGRPHMIKKDLQKYGVEEGN
jgi:DNA repair photolyase